MCFLSAAKIVLFTASNAHQNLIAQFVILEPTLCKEIVLILAAINVLQSAQMNIIKLVEAAISALLLAPLANSLIQA